MSDVPLDYAVFQLSPRRSRCELFVSYNGTTEKVASGLVKPFVTHLKVAEEQVARSSKSIKLEVERQKISETWFTKGTLERFVRFVSTPEVLELVNTYDAEMSQLEAARNIYSQGPGDGGSGGDGSEVIAASDATKKELLRAIDVRLVAVSQDLATTCNRASAAGFNPGTISGLQLFADQFGAYRLLDACSKFSDLCQRRPELFSSWKSRVDDSAIRSSSESDMSLDDVGSDPQTNSFHSPQLEQPEEATSPTLQPSDKPPLQFHFHRSSRESSVDKDDLESGNRNNEKREEGSSQPIKSDTPSTQPQLTRRLSVQERISMFENKQKELSSSAGSGVAKPAVGKSTELRRLSSDVSSAVPVGPDKAVLRRWSGASDMSIDVSGERKEVNSNASTPTSAFASVEHGSSFSLVSENKDYRGVSSGTSGSMKPEIATPVPDQVGDDRVKNKADTKKEEVKIKPFIRAKSEALVTPSIDASLDSSDLKLNPVFGSGRSKSAECQNQSSGISSSTESCLGAAEDSGMINQISSVVLPNKREQIDSGGDTASLGNMRIPYSEEESVSGSQFKTEESAMRKVQPIQKAHVAVSACESSYDPLVVDAYQSAPAEVVEGAGLRKQRALRTQYRTSQRTSVDMPCDPASSILSSQPSPHNERDETAQVAQSKWRSNEGESDQEGGKLYESAENPADGSSSVNFEDSRTSRRIRVQKQGSTSDHSKKSSRRRDNSGSGTANSFLGRRVSESQENLSSTPSDQTQRLRLPRANQERNDELKMKANELEKLFAEHKLRAPGDQSSAARRSKSVETQEQEKSSSYKSISTEASTPQTNSMKLPAEPRSSNMNKFSGSPMIHSLASQDNDVMTPKQNVFSLTPSDESRGKLYDKYMQKRDAKLKEGWSTNKVEKEARMKAMQQSLEQSEAELKSQLFGSADRQDTQHRADKFRAFYSRSAVRREQPIHSLLNDGDEVPYREDGVIGDNWLADGPSRSAQSKRVILNSSIAASTPRSVASHSPRTSAKTSVSAGGRRKPQAENPLGQSVPNFSDLRKENTKPSFVGSRVGSRSQARSYHRSKSSSEDVLAVKDEKTRRPQHMRKSSATPLELNDSLSLLDPHSALTPTKYDDEFADDDFEFPSSIEGRSFPRGGNSDVGSITNSRIPRSVAPFVAEALENEIDKSFSVSKDDEDSDSFVDEDCVDTEVGKSRESQESVEYECNNGDSLALRSQFNPSSAAELPATLPSAFRSMGSLMDSPGGSPGSWNSRIHNPFSYPHEHSDFDASMDSPIGSPANWNQIDSDTARMRKKWGAAQKPLVVSDASNGQSRKDMTKGLKRFLKFGRKNRGGGDSTVDWVSATTSEGDDDTEDGRDPANRSSEDLRKSRMGFSHYHASDDGFSESDSFNEPVQAFSSSIPTPPMNFKLREDPYSGSSLKAPKSFFSLSTFRSKGSEAKPR